MLSSIVCKVDEEGRKAVGSVRQWALSLEVEQTWELT
jgi:hypothetical protein